MAVIGGGIVGLFTALFHKRAHPSHHVVVLEKGAFPSGASVRNAGFACFGSPSELLADIATVKGLEGFGQLVDAVAAANAVVEISTSATIIIRCNGGNPKPAISR